MSVVPSSAPNSINNSLSELLSPTFLGILSTSLFQKTANGIALSAPSKNSRPAPFAQEETSVKISALLYLICVWSSEIKTLNLPKKSRLAPSFLHSRVPTPKPVSAISVQPKSLRSMQLTCPYDLPDFADVFAAVKEHDALERARFEQRIRVRLVF